jgi:hypothetical protein
MTHREANDLHPLGGKELIVRGDEGIGARVTGGLECTLKIRRALHLERLELYAQDSCCSFRLLEL